MVYIEF